MNHREPPKPPGFDNTPRGVCRWCQKPTTEPRRYHWHAKCLEEYLAWREELSTPNRRVIEAAGDRCQCCGTSLLVEETDRHGNYAGYTREVWNDDHIIPLIDALPHADDPWWQWRLSNRQALCPACHRAKTAREATMRAGWRRRYQETKEQGLQMALPLEAA